MVLYSLAVPGVRFELLRCVSAHSLCFIGKKGLVYWGLDSGKRTCPLRGVELCSRLALFRILSLHALPP
jgi:hypothetical protein